MTKPLDSRPKGINRPVGYVGNLYGYPAILAVGGRNYDDAEELWPTDADIFLLEDLTSADGISVHQTRDLGIGSFARGIVKRVNDEVFIVQGFPTNRPGTAGKDIFIWNYHEGKPELRGQYSEWRTAPGAVVLSGKYFRTCFENNIRKFKKSF